MIENLPFLNDLGIPLESYEVHGSVALVRINAVEQDVFSHLAQSTGLSSITPDGWYLANVACATRKSSWSTGNDLILEGRPRTIIVGGHTLIEDVVLTFRHIPNPLVEREEAMRDLLNGLY